MHAQNVGIGFTSPKSQLTVNGNFALGADYNTAAPTNGALIEGDVGIGLTTPQVPLHVDGSIWVATGGITGAFWAGTANIDGTESPLRFDRYPALRWCRPFFEQAARLHQRLASTVDI